MKPEVQMTRLLGWGLTGWMTLVGMTLGGCATTAGQPLAHDVRGDAVVSGHQVQPLVAGPIELLHANFDTRAKLQFTKVWRRSPTVDCSSGTPLAWNGESVVEIEKDELVCVAAPVSTRVSWHGRPLRQSGPATPAQASLR